MTGDEEREPDEDRLPCGCGREYHLADCPLRDPPLGTDPPEDWDDPPD